MFYVKTTTKTTAIWDSHVQKTATEKNDEIAASKNSPNTEKPANGEKNEPVGGRQQRGVDNHCMTSITRAVTTTKARNSLDSKPTDSKDFHASK